MKPMPTASRWRTCSPGHGTPRPAPRSSWWTTAGRQFRWSRRPSRSTGTGPTATATTTPSSTPSNWRRADGHANGNGNGHHDEEPAEGQQSLFSWAEFLADEPAQPNGRNGKPKTASASLFQWALDKEQEREKEPVGAGALGTQPLISNRRRGTPLASGVPSSQLTAFLATGRRARLPTERTTNAKELNRWHACLCMTTASFPTRTPR